MSTLDSVLPKEIVQCAIKQTENINIIQFQKRPLFQNCFAFLLKLGLL